LNRHRLPVPSGGASGATRRHLVRQLRDPAGNRPLWVGSGRRRYGTLRSSNSMSTPLGESVTVISICKSDRPSSSVQRGAQMDQVGLPRPSIATMSKWVLESWFGKKERPVAVITESKSSAVSRDATHIPRAWANFRWETRPASCIATAWTLSVDIVPPCKSESLDLNTRPRPSRHMPSHNCPLWVGSGRFERGPVRLPASNHGCPDGQRNHPKRPATRRIGLDTRLWDVAPRPQRPSSPEL